MKTHEVPLFIVERRAANPPRRRIPRYRVSLVKEAGSVYVTSKPIRTANDVHKLADTLFEDADIKTFYALYLDSKSKIIGVGLWVGTNTAPPAMNSGEVFKAAILVNAYAIIGVCNHPSGSLEPLLTDRAVADVLLKHGVTIGIALHDYIIYVRADQYGNANYFSFQEQGLLE